MGRITLRVLDGADKGRVYSQLETPITIGREEGNSIQLNDERVSRYHIKIQEDRDKLVLTDLQSTNGTRVNGEDVQLRNLRFGDLIQLGRTTLVMGSREQIAGRLKELREQPSSRSDSPGIQEARKRLAGSSNELPWDEPDNLQEMLFHLEPPELPERLSPGQAAQLAEILEYLLVSIRHLLLNATEDKQTEGVQLDARRWQSLIDLQSRIAEYLRQIGDPDDQAGAKP